LAYFYIYVVRFSTFKRFYILIFKLERESRRVFCIIFLLLTAGDVWLSTFSNILTALKGYFFKADHGFVVYRLHSHDFIANGYPRRSVRPAIDHRLCLQPLTPILNGLGDI